jgi:broad specificity phosphatase PhoE
MQRRLHLVKHAMPVKVAARPSREWVLADEGRALAARLAGRLAGAGIDRFVSSTEPKARETAEIMAGALGVPCEAADGLHEQEREGMPFFATPADLDAAMRDFFARPAERVFGQESADEASARYSLALERVVGGADGDGALAVVSHGTVMTLFIARHNRVDPFELWRSLGLPSSAVLSLPDLRLLEIIQTPE